MCTIALTRPSALRRTATIALAGDLDDHDRRAIADVIVAALTAGCDGIEIDLSGLTFFGAAGANALVESRNACHGAATALTLARPPASRQLASRTRAPTDGASWMVPRSHRRRPRSERRRARRAARAIRRT